MKRLSPSERPEKEVVKRGGLALICKHDENQKHSWYGDGRAFNPASEPNLNVSRPVSSVSSHPTTATLRERLRAKRWADEIDTEATKKSKFEAPGPPPPVPPLPPPRPPDKNKKTNVPVLEGYVDLPSYVPRPLDGGYSYAVAAASFSGNVVVGGAIHSFSPFLNTFSSYYTASIGNVSWISSSMIGSYYWAGIFATNLTNKYGYRSVFIGGSVLASGAYALTIFAKTTSHLVGTQGFMAGIGMACIFIPSTMSIGNYFEEKRATASGFTRAGAGLGTMAFPPVANWLIKSLGWKGANLIIALFILIVGIIMGLFMRSVEVPKMKEQYLHDRVAEIYKTYETGDERDEIHEKYINSTAISNDKTSFKKFLGYFTKTRNDSSDHILENNELERFGTKLSSQDNNKQHENENIYYLKYHDKEDQALKGLKVVPSTSEKTTYGNLNSWFCCSKGEKYYTVPPLAREDVFYAGNIRNLKEFDQYDRSMPTYNWETTIIPNTKKVISQVIFGDTKSSNSASGWWKTFTDLVDLKLLKSPVISLLVAATFAGVLGAYIPFTFYRDAAISKGIDSTWATFLISFMGVPNFIEGLLSGVIAVWFKKANTFALWINNISLFFAGLCMVLTPLAVTIVDFSVIAVFYGIFIFIYFSLTTIILVELRALKDLTAGIKLLMLFKGIAATIGNPIAGYINDWTNSSDGSFYFCGSVLFLSALLHSLLPLASRYCLHKATLFTERNDEDEFVEQRRDMLQKGFEKFITLDSDKKKSQGKSKPEQSNNKNRNNFFNDDSNDWQIQDLENAGDYDDKNQILDPGTLEETSFDSPGGEMNID